MNADDEYDIKLYQVETIGTTSEDSGIVSATVSGGTKKNDTHVITTNAIEMEVAAVMSLLSLKQLMRYIKPKQSHHYLCLDTYNGIFSPDRTQIQWLINDGDPVVRPNYINLSRPLQNIIMMRLGRMSWSSMDVTNTNILNNNKTGIGVGFDEFASQSALIPAGPKIHFIQIISAACTALGPGIRYDYDTLSVGNTITTSSFFENRGWFRFRKHFTKLDTLTMNLWNLFDMTKIIIPDVYLTLPAIQWYDHLQVGSPTPFPINMTSGNLQMLPIVYAVVDGAPNYNYPLTLLGEQFLYGGFTTNDPIADAELIAEYNTVHPFEFANPILGNPFPVILPPINIASAHLVFNTNQPITITFLYKPRMIATLELITEDI
jgi:hypothetical protein